MLNAIAGMMDGGSIELLTGNGGVLATLKLSDPAAQTATGDSTRSPRATPRWQDQAATARIVASDGSEVFSCDVGDENSNGVVKLPRADHARRPGADQLVPAGDAVTLQKRPRNR
jgi:hypothetical protein